MKMNYNAKALKKRIMHRIETLEVARRRRARIGAGLLMVVGIASTLFTGFEAYVSASQTALFSYLSIILSDMPTMFVHWKYLTFAILESVPVLGVAATILSLALFAYACARFMRAGYAQGWHAGLPMRQAV